ncbi:MAG: putative 15 kDa heat shock protein [Planctomycetota bacterium]|nr:MAG: putative 15 kDa heat shock protein [Planctomycetota bacterium]
MADQITKAAPAQQPAETRQAPLEATSTRPTVAPRCDIAETEDALYVLADMPGVTKDGLEVTLDGDVLTLCGRIQPFDPGKRSALYQEYREADYYRAFRLSEEVDRERIEASLDKGVLRLVLPKVKPQKKKIEVKAG